MSNVHPQQQTLAQTQQQQQLLAHQAQQQAQLNRKFFGLPMVNRDGREIRAIGAKTGHFAAYLRDAPDQELLSFFRGIATELQERQLTDFHFKVQNHYNWRTRTTLPGWHVVVIYGNKDDDEGPLQVDRCMSCDLDCPLSLGVLGGRPAGAAAGASPPADPGPLSSDSLLQEDAVVRCWLDAKARPMMIVTPMKHVETMQELDDVALLGMWKAASWCLQQLQTDAFTSMILNHGTSRNHAHLHLKIRVSAPDFDRAQLSWPQEWLDKLAALRKFAGTLPTDSRGTYDSYRIQQSNKRSKA
jgi:diadenosine tetraphosphate (Ap4A) HIT family hydrolase